VFEEFLAAEVGLLYALFGEFRYHFGFCCDSGMVGSGYPEGILAVHSCTAHKDVLNGVVEHMAHVEHTGHVWRWDDDAERLTCVGSAVEQVVAKPIGVPFVLHFGRIVFSS
jgi:hypothetical protein